MPDPDQILLQTKLHRPRQPRDLVVRARLIELLNNDLDRQLILVCAPAGFGKTTLVGTWLDQLSAGQDHKAASLPSAWLSLDEKDNDLNLFLRYVIAALRKVFKNACPETTALLQARQLLPKSVFYATFINELVNLPGKVVLVLDDYHIIHDPDVHNLLGELVRHWPELLHLVVISRLSPPIPLDNLRAKGRINEIRTRDLRFTPEETAAYLRRTQPDSLVQQALPLLEERFEGWPAGLHLAAISLRSENSRDSVLSVLSTENANITGYLMGEVLTRQAQEIQSFLLRTSILDRFCPSLCEAVLGKTDSAWNVRACLNWIELSELFIIHLDNRREWYRYHHLFQELLQQRLTAEMSPQEVAQLHGRASAWCEEKGLLDEALQHALAAGDIDLAAHQMSAGLCEVINREDRQTLERWLRMLPDGVIQRHPELMMLRAWALEFSWRLDLQAQVLQEIEDLLDSEASATLPVSELQTLRGQLLTFKAQQAYFHNQPDRAMDLCKQALTMLPPAWKFVRGGAMLFFGISMQASGFGKSAERLLLDEFESCSDKTDSYALFLLESLSLIYLYSGQLEKARHTGQLLVHNATSSQLELNKSWGYYFLGMVHYQRNELEAAAEHFSGIIKRRFTAQIAVYRDAVAGLVLIHHIKGERSDAAQTVESISQFDLEQGGREDERTRCLRARLMLLQGDLVGASDWVDTFADPPADQPLLWLEEPQVTRVRVLLARGTVVDLQTGLQLLDALDEIVDRTHNTRVKIELLALRALVLDAQGEKADANAVLKRAVDLARPGGFIRVFVDLGKVMQELLLQLAVQDHSAEMVRRLVAAFPENEGVPIQRGSSGKPGGKSDPENEPLVESLTPREIEVLNLLRGPASIKEIALDLHISYATAKRHTINIYGKLGVSGRWNAVARAEELNLLPPR